MRFPGRRCASASPGERGSPRPSASSRLRRPRCRRSRALVLNRHEPSDRYDLALRRLLAIGGADFDARAASVCAELGLGAGARPAARRRSRAARRRVRPSPRCSSRRRTSCCSTSRRTTSTPTGSSASGGSSWGIAGAVVLVSHDRAFLDSTVDRIAEIDPRSRRIVEWSGGWTDYVTRRDEARRAAYARFADAQERRRELTSLLSTRRTEARSQGAGLGEKSGGADRRGTNALRTKVRQTERLLERNPLPEKPFEPWELRLELRASRPGRVAGRATVRRGRPARIVPPRAARRRGSPG